jgi:hypothetical protein
MVRALARPAPTVYAQGMMRGRSILALGLLCGCGGDPIAGTWRSDSVPSVGLELEDDLTGTLELDGVVYVATASREQAYRYTLERCSVFPAASPVCAEHRCVFEDDDDLFDDDDDGPSFSTLTCDLGGRDRFLYAD